MRQDAVTLERFYAAPLGRAASRVLAGKLIDLWGDAAGLSMLGLGYAIPALEAFGTAPSRIIAAVPYEHGPVSWSASERGNAAVAVGDPRLPFPDGLFDRVIVLHGLEETGDPRAYLREIWRGTAPGGRGGGAGVGGRHGGRRGGRGAPAPVWPGPPLDAQPAVKPPLGRPVPGHRLLQRALH